MWHVLNYVYTLVYIYFIKVIPGVVCAKLDWFIWFIVFNATFSNISAISWRPVLVVEETGVPVENHRVTNWRNIFVDQGQFSDPDFISGTHQREKVQFADKSMFSWLLLFCIWSFFLINQLKSSKFELE